jgi:LacI family transcriptional regulator
MKVRIKDIAERANVSVGTVDRVLHNRGEVSPETRKKILEIIREFNYEPDILASTLASKKEARFGTLIPTYTHDSKFWQNPAEGITKGINEISHFGVKIIDHNFDLYRKESFVKQASALLTDKPDGVLVAPVFSAETLDFLTKLNTLGIPFVMLNAHQENTPEPISFIGQDPLQSGLLAAKLLTYGSSCQGHYLIVNIVRDSNVQTHMQQRESGFRKYFETHCRHSVLHRILVNGTSQQLINNELNEYFSSHKDVKGIFVTNSKVYKVANFLESHQMNDLRLIGYDLLEESRYYLENGIIDFLIGQKPEEQGYRAVMALFTHLVLKRKVESNQYMPLDIITRENIQYYK